LQIYAVINSRLARAGNNNHNFRQSHYTRKK